MNRARPTTKAKGSGNNWQERPDKYDPEPLTILNVMRWQTAINAMIEKTYNRAGDLYRRNYDFMAALGYKNIRLVEAAAMLGRDYWHMNTGAPTIASRGKMANTSILSLEEWAKYYKIPVNAESGEDLQRAIDYITETRRGMLEAYIKAAEQEIINRKRTGQPVKQLIICSEEKASTAAGAKD